MTALLQQERGSKMLKYMLIYIVSVLISSVSQIILKTSSGKTYDSFIREYLNPRVIIAYGLFFLTTFISLYAYKVIPLSMGPILESTGYIWVAILSFVILGEKISKRKLTGLLVIIAGIVVYSI